MISLYRANRAAWVGKLLKFKELTFAKVFQTRIKASLNDIVRMNFGKQWAHSKPVPTFYKDMLIWFRNLIPCKQPSNGNEVRRHIIWNNVDVCIQQVPMSCQLAYNNGVKYIDDFVDQHGRLLSYQEFRTKYPLIRVDPLTYIRWVRAVPRQWKRLLEHSHPMTVEERNSLPVIEVGKKMVLLKLIKPNFYYAKYLTNYTPTAQQRWQEEGIDFGDNWHYIYSVPFTVTSSTRLQSLQYRLLQRYFPTRRFLCIRKVIEGPFCNECGEIDTLKHYFTLCHEVFNFWKELIEIVNIRLPARHKFEMSTKNILFGDAAAIKIVNFIVLVAKQYIILQRTQDCSISMPGFRPFLHRYFLMEKCNSEKKSEDSDI